MKNKLLIIGCLPKEAGGSYTQGICNVVYELSKHPIADYDVQLFAINAPNRIVRNNRKHVGFTFHGYSYLRIYRVLLHPMKVLTVCARFVNITKMSWLRAIFYYANLDYILKATKPDIIHTHVLYLMNMVGQLRNSDTPHLVTFHGIFLGSNNCLNLIEESRPYITHATGLTDETCTRIKDRGFCDNQIFKVSNGVDTSKFFYSPACREELRRSIKSNCTKILITVASLQPRKGQYDFIKNIASYLNNIEYWVIGIGPDYDRLNKYIIENELGDKIKLLGYVANTDLYKYYSAADIYVHTSYEEGQALSEIEAYTTGLKVLVNESIQGTIVNDINDTSTYMLYSPRARDLEGIQNWISQNRYDERITRDKFDWSKVSKEYRTVYNKLLKKNE